MTDRRTRAASVTSQRPFRPLAAASLLVVLTSGCGSAGGGPAVGAATAMPAVGVPLSHVHGVGIDPAGGTLVLATHEGLFEVGPDGAAARVGPVIDLMGFVVAGPGHFLASGHPGPGTDLPEPVGLLESTDGGKTWEPVSRQGVSDFHALTTGEAGIVGYDGMLWRSDDGREWEQETIPAAPATLAASPTGTAVVATTAEGLLQSDVPGGGWSPVREAPLLQVVDWTPDGAALIGITPSGELWTSEDRGATWQQGTDLGSAPLAMDVLGTGTTARIAVVTVNALLESRDNGQSFDVVLER